MRANPTTLRDRPPGRSIGLLMGIGLGGFVDGIVLHQMLQWHHLVSHVEGLEPDTLHALQVNTLADGAFHLLAWACVLLGSTLGIRAWRQGRFAPSWRFHFGLVAVGWGAFNLVEGVVNHHILGIHHVRDDLGAPLSWDLAFLGVSAVLVLVGWLLYRSAGGSTGRHGSTP